MLFVSELLVKFNFGRNFKLMLNFLKYITYSFSQFDDYKNVKIKYIDGLK